MSNHTYKGSDRGLSTTETFSHDHVFYLLIFYLIAYVSVVKAHTAFSNIAYPPTIIYRQKHKKHVINIGKNREQVMIQINTLNKILETDTEYEKYKIFKHKIKSIKELTTILKLLCKNGCLPIQKDNVSNVNNLMISWKGHKIFAVSICSVEGYPNVNVYQQLAMHITPENDDNMNTIYNLNDMDDDQDDFDDIQQSKEYQENLMEIKQMYDMYDVINNNENKQKKIEHNTNSTCIFQDTFNNNNNNDNSGSSNTNNNILNHNDQQARLNIYQRKHPFKWNISDIKWAVDSSYDKNIRYRATIKQRKWENGSIKKYLVHYHGFKSHRDRWVFEDEIFDESNSCSKKN